MRFILNTCLLITLISGNSSAQNLGTLAEGADVIVVGKASNIVVRSDGVTFSLSVIRGLKGTVTAGDVLAVNVALRADARAPNPAAVLAEGCGLYAVKKVADAWWMPQPNIPLLPTVMVPLGNCSAGVAYPEQASPAERMFLEIADAASKDDYLASQLFYFADRSSPIVDAAMKEAALSSNPQVRSSGIAWLVVHGDSDSLQELERLVSGPMPKFGFGRFNTAVSNYRNPTPAGIHVIGRLASGETMDPSLRRSASHALRAIHTREAIPYLAALLEASDSRLQEEAVSGLTEYVKHVAIAPDGPDKAKALDEAFNPARRGNEVIPEKDLLHIGVFKDPSEQKRFVEIWRAWWQSHKQEFLR